jgi:hypothetical protein
MVFEIMGSIFVGFFLNCLVIFRRRVDVPDFSVVREVRVVQKTVARLAVTNHPPSVVTEGIILELLV